MEEEIKGEEEIKVNGILRSGRKKRNGEGQSEWGDLLSECPNDAIECGSDVSKVGYAATNQKRPLTTIWICCSTLQEEVLSSTCR